MAKKIRINFRDIEAKEFDSGTTLKEISREFEHYFNYPILIGLVENDLVELNEPITRSNVVDFYDRSSDVGNGIHGRTAQFLLTLAVKRLFGEEVEVMIEYSIDKGFYCEIVGIEIDKSEIKKLENEMKKICSENLPIGKVSVSRLDAIKYFQKKKQYDKVRVLKYISNTYINLYHVDETFDYFYGKLAYSTKDVEDFKLTYIRDNGFVLSYPSSYNPECTLDYVHHEKLFEKFLEYNNWGRKIGVSNASELNEIVSMGNYDNLIRLSEVYYSNQLARISDHIAENRNIRVVLIAGPSSAGKTTTARKLSVYLQTHGLIPHQISLDDYFIDREKTPKLENGELDTESLKAIDITLFNKHLIKILDGEKVEIPDYNFVFGKREYKGKTLQLEENGIIIIEGLHCLNDELTMPIDRNCKYKIYINALTQVNIDNHNRVHTSDNRKLRRIVRDSKFRGFGAEKTLHMWKTIREGEEKYIFPYQDDADEIVNSALTYELGVLKTYVEPLLFNVPETDPSYPEAIRLINLLRNFLPIPSEEVPKDSVLREFIGGSSFYRK